VFTDPAIPPIRQVGATARFLAHSRVQSGLPVPLLGEAEVPAVGILLRDRADIPRPQFALPTATIASRLQSAGRAVVCISREESTNA